MRWLTPAQDKVYRLLLETEDANKPPPTIKEISDELGMTASLVHRRVQALETKGYIDRSGYRS